MKYFLIAGEASGDLHGSNIMRDLKIFDPAAEFFYTGGNLMQAEGGTMIRHYDHMAYMGVMEVLANLNKISRNFKLIKKAILDSKPDLLILIDYPGFNLRMAKWAKKNGIRAFMYVSPTVWAWKENRVKTIKECIEKMFVILPFEVDFYKERHGYDVYFTGNPIVDVVESFKESTNTSHFRNNNNLGAKPIVALLSGSRKQEIQFCLPAMMSLVDKFPGYQFVIAGAPSLAKEVYLPYLEQQRNIKIVYGKTYELLSNAHAAVVTSGTATLETALFNVPEAVVYKMNSIVFHIGKFFIMPRFFSLVNLIMGRTVVQELLQTKLEEKAAAELDRILHDKHYREQMLRDYKELRGKMNRGAYYKTAELMYTFLTSE